MKKKNVIYISGAISGLPRQEYIKRFADAEQELIKQGYKVLNPTKLLPSRHLWVYGMLGYKITLLYDIWHLMKCEGIYMIDGWENSKGARLEKATAEIFELKVIL
jgi:hypothetical protein